jgi:hypothetical protein
MRCQVCSQLMSIKQLRLASVLGGILRMGAAPAAHVMTR